MFRSGDLSPEQKIGIVWRQRFNVCTEALVKALPYREIVSVQGLHLSGLYLSTSSQSPHCQGGKFTWKATFALILSEY